MRSLQLIAKKLDLKRRVKWRVRGDEGRSSRSRWTRKRVGRGGRHNKTKSRTISYAERRTIIYKGCTPARTLTNRRGRRLLTRRKNNRRGIDKIGRRRTRGSRFRGTIRWFALKYFFQRVDNPSRTRRSGRDDGTRGFFNRSRSLSLAFGPCRNTSLTQGTAAMSITATQAAKCSRIGEPFALISSLCATLALIKMLEQDLRLSKTGTHLWIHDHPSRTLRTIFCDLSLSLITI